MDGFFEKYGRMIVVAVAICFVLLFLTPMRNVVGSSINGFVGNFANKVGESLGTVKMPDGSESGGKFTVPEGVKAGSILKIERTEYIVLEQRANNQALVMTTSSIGMRAFQSGVRSDGQSDNTYEGSAIDNYLENNWYNSLSSTMKAAIQTTSIKQASYKTYNGPNSKYETGYEGQVYNTISRHVFLPGVGDISKVVNLKNVGKVQAFLNGTSIWTRDSYQGDTNGAKSLNYGFGSLNSNYVYISYGVRPTFVIDLTKVQSEVVGTTNYK